MKTIQFSNGIHKAGIDENYPLTKTNSSSGNWVVQYWEERTGYTGMPYLASLSKYFFKKSEALAFIKSFK